MNVLLLMAGSSEDFLEAGYLYPKSLVEIQGLPIVQHVVQSLSAMVPQAKFIFAIRQNEDQQYHIGAVIRLLVPEAIVMAIPEKTSGAACTALLASAYFDDGPLLIVNGDQIIEADVASIVKAFKDAQVDGGIVVFEAVHPRWSYVRCDRNGYVQQAAEKNPISNLATAGMYYFARSRDFTEAAMQMIVKDAHVDGFFYVCPVYNEMILKQARIVVHCIERRQYFSLAHPRSVEDYTVYLTAKEKV